MTSIDEDLVLVERVPSIRSGRWHTDARLLAVFNISVSVDSLPDIILNLEEPTVIEARLFNGFMRVLLLESRFAHIASEDEYLLLVRIGNSDVLMTRSWEVFSSAFKLGPMHFL